MPKARIIKEVPLGRRVVVERLRKKVSLLSLTCIHSHCFVYIFFHMVDGRKGDLREVDNSKTCNCRRCKINFRCLKYSSLFLLAKLDSNGSSSLAVDNLGSYMYILSQNKDYNKINSRFAKCCGSRIGTTLIRYRIRDEGYCKIVSYRFL